MTRFSGEDILRAELPDWRFLEDGLRTRFAFRGFVPGATLVAAITEAAEAANHHPDLSLGYGRLDVTLTSHDAGGVTDRDVALAREISGLAAGMGVEAVPEGLMILQLALDTPDSRALRPFWRALLGYSEAPGDHLVDPTGLNPKAWFQDSEERDGTDRFHLDVIVPDDAVAERLAAVLAAGGTLVTDEFAPAWWVLADPQGNRACVCTWHRPGDSFAFDTEVRAAIDRGPGE